MLRSNAARSVGLEQDTPACCDDLGFTAENLNHQVGLVFVGCADLEAASATLHERLGADHFSDGPTASETAAELAKRGVGKACHRREDGAALGEFAGVKGFGLSHNLGHRLVRLPESLGARGKNLCHSLCVLLTPGVPAAKI